MFQFTTSGGPWHGMAHKPSQACKDSIILSELVSNAKRSQDNISQEFYMKQKIG